MSNALELSPNEYWTSDREASTVYLFNGLTIDLGLVFQGK